MLTRLFRFIGAFMLVVPFCAFAQSWTPSANDILSNCPNGAPCKVVVNQAYPSYTGVALDVSGNFIVRGASPFLGVYGLSGPASFAVDAPATQLNQILLRSGGAESVYLRRDASNNFSIITANDFAVSTANVEKMRLTAAGRLGIGTAVPTAKLSILGTNDIAQVRIGNPSNTGVIAAYVLNQEAMSIALGADLPNGAAGGWIAQDTTAAFVGKNVGKFVILGSANNTVGNPALAIRELFSIDIKDNIGTFSGAVAIGGSLPALSTKKLYVVGDAQFVGEVRGTKIRAQYQDVAEWVPSADDLAPGTVVVVDKRTGNTVRASMTAYDTAVAGVVSGEPGIILGEESASKEQVATTGRVRVRVDASKGAIQPGDLLVTSDVPGTAMKSAPVDIGGISMHRPGTIIGKALEPMDSGVGEILVLLSLQ